MAKHEAKHQRTYCDYSVHRQAGMRYMFVGGHRHWVTDEQATEVEEYVCKRTDQEKALRGRRGAK